MNITRTKDAARGNAIAIPAKIRTSMPSPIVAQRDLFSRNIPLITFSIPTKSNITESKTTTERNVNPGNASANIESMIVRAPSPIWTPRNQRGGLTNDNELFSINYFGM